MLKLLVDSQKVSNAICRISWCIDPKDHHAVKALPNPHVLLVVVANGIETGRELIRLGKLTDYIQFNAAGHNVVYGAIVWDENGNEEKLRSRYLGKGTNSYISLLDTRRGNYTDFGKNQFYDLKNSRGHTEIDVTVSEALFAKKPWDYKWVTLWFKKSKPKDQCGYRSRRLVAYTIQPPAMLIAMVWWICKSITMFITGAIMVVLFGMRGINFKRALRPHIYDFGSIWWWNEGSVFVSDKNGNKRHPLFLLLSPIVPLGVIALILFKKSFLVFAALALVFFAVMAITSPLFGKLFKIREEKAKEKERKAIDNLLCDDSNPTPPKVKRTAHLWYMETKAKVCKPFSS